VDARAYSANDAVTEIAAQYLPGSEIVTIRAVFALVVAILITL
jgi:hypothetical protein